MNYFGFQGWLSPSNLSSSSSSSIRSAFPGSRCRPTRECRLRIAQRISDTFLKCKTFRLRVRREGGGARRRCLGSLLQARYTKPFDRLYIVHPVPRIFPLFFSLLFLVFLARFRGSCRVTYFCTRV